MSFRQITRRKSPALPFYCTKAMGVRFASHPIGSGMVTVIWVGCDLAAQIGLSGDRHLVNFLLDDSDPSNIRAAIELNDATGEYRASRRYRDVAVFLDKSASEDCFGNAWFHDHVSPESIRVEGARLEFAVPAFRRRTGAAA